jgi:hypothetical protein
VGAVIEGSTTCHEPFLTEIGLAKAHDCDTSAFPLRQDPFG